MIGLLQKLLDWFAHTDSKFTLLLAPLIPFLLGIYALLSFGHVMLATLLSKLDEAIALLNQQFPQLDLTSVASDFWVNVNTFVPLDLIFELGLILISLKAIMAVVRVIKSFVPTIS